MTKPKASPKQEIFQSISNLMLGKSSAREQFSGYELPSRFHVVQPQNGIFLIVQELPGQVLQYSTLEAVVSVLVTWSLTLPEEWKDFKLTTSAMEQAAKYWMARREALLTQRVYPVLEKSQPGYCWRRLPYDAQEGPAPCYESIMSHVETNRFAYEAFVGATLDETFERQYYAWLKGAGKDGKGSLMTLKKSIFGDAYGIMPSDPKQQNQFTAAGLVGKRVVAIQDCQYPRIVQTELFMQVTGGDPIRIEDKRKPAYTADVDAMIFVSSNFMPEITGSKAHMRRIILVTFKERTQYDEDERTFKTRLLQEAPFILWRWKEAWRKMKSDHGGMKVDQEITEDVAAATDLKWTSVLERFFIVDTSKRGELRAETFRDILREEARLNDFEIRDFKNYLERHGVKMVQTRDGEKRERIMVGLHRKATASTNSDGTHKF